jgi:hypothetical protein
MSSFENFVQCRIVTPLSASATDVALYAAVAPYRLPPAAGGVLVLTDSPGNPSVVEVVRYSHRTDLALYGLQRGQEGTTARDWAGPVFCYQALMAGDLQSILDELNAGIDGKVDKAAGQSLMTDAERTKLSGIAAGAQVNTVTSVAGKTGAVALAKADVGLGNVDNTSDVNKPVSTAQQTALNLKANLASPTFTGTPKAPTPATTDNSTLIANTAFVQAVVAALVDSSPAALDTLKEFATALGNDPNFATTITNALALKAPLASPALTGNPTAPTAAADDNDTSIATTAFVRAAMALFGVGVTNTLATVTADLDTLATAGTFWINTASTNKPGADSGQLVVLASPNTSTNSQLFYAAQASGTPKLYFRQKNYSTAAWNAWQEVWHTGNLVKQQNPTDKTAGAMLTVGAFGLGSLANTPLNGIDLNTTELPIGFYSGNAWANTPIGTLSSSTWAYLQVENLASAFPFYVKQTFTANSGSSLVWTRVKYNGTWGNWRQQYHAGNILGTVGQSGGVPTGAIIERGSNSNGEYVRFADGTQICVASLTYPAGAESMTWTLPAGFASSNYFVSHLSSKASSSLAGSFVHESWPAGVGSALLKTLIHKATDISYTGADLVVKAFAKGRWY